MAFRSQRYHLSQGVGWRGQSGGGAGEGKKKNENRDAGRERKSEEEEEEECTTGVCTETRAAARDGIGICTLCEDPGPLISLILNILWDASGIK